MYVINRLGKGLLNLFLLTLAAVAISMVLVGPLFLLLEVHWAWGLLYTPHVAIAIWKFGEEC